MLTVNLTIAVVETSGCRHRRYRILRPLSCTGAPSSSPPSLTSASLHTLARTARGSRVVTERTLCNAILLSDFDHDWTSTRECERDIKDGLEDYDAECSQTDYDRLLSDLQDCITDSRDDTEVEECFEWSIERASSRCGMDLDTGW